MDLNMVVRHVVWHAEDDAETQWLNKRDVWTKEPSDAWLYSSHVAFTSAASFGGGVFVRLPGGREVDVSEEDMFPEKGDADGSA